jgi:putative ABC transport system ATP-binding protein
MDGRTIPPEVTAVQLERVSRDYPSGDEQIHGLRDVTLSVARGELVALMGPSGSGKTTLLSLVAGLDRPTTGRVLVFGTEISAATEDEATLIRARNIGMAFQHALLLPGLTALENVVVAKLPWRPREALTREASELLSAVGLEARRDFPPARLSAGEQQRVAIARALLGGPRLLLADEPTGNLDAATAAAFVMLLQKLRRERELTVLLATHDPSVASAADRIVHLVSGAIG